jgi:alkylhydroperoxidase family enzyme
MPWIEVIPLEKATGLLKREYEKAIKRAGRIWNVVSIMSQNPNVMTGSMEMYSATMYGPSPLSRSQREMLALVTSATNHCVY